MFLKASLFAALFLSLASAQIYSSIRLPAIQPPQFNLCSSQSQCCDGNTITTSGRTTFQAGPDLASISTQISASGKTTADAVNTLSGLFDKIVAILTKNGLTNQNYKTSNFNVYPNTTWNNGVSTINGQIASQGFDVTLPFASSDGSAIGKLIDDLATVNGVTINNLSFDIKNKTAVYAKGRTLAFQDANAKAQDYANALFLRIGRVIHVSDSFSSVPVVTPGPVVMAMQVADTKVASTNIEVGTIPISYNVEVVYSFS